MFWYYVLKWCFDIMFSEFLNESVDGRTEMKWNIFYMIPEINIYQKECLITGFLKMYKPMNQPS